VVQLVKKNSTSITDDDDGASQTICWFRIFMTKEVQNYSASAQ